MAGTATINSALFKGLLLDYYYERRADSEIGNGKRFRLNEALFGKSTLVTPNTVSGGGWKISDIPPDFTRSDLTNQFATVKLKCSTKGSTITIMADITDADIKDNNPHDFNTLVLTDDDNKAVAVMCCQQDTLMKGKTFSCVMTIEQKVN